MTTINQDMDPRELQQRLVYTLFLPAVTLAMRFKLPLSWMKRTMETAYFQQAREAGLSLKDICALMDISISKSALLSKQLKEGFIAGLKEEQDESFDEQEALSQLDLSARIEYMLWAGPLTLPRLNQILPQERFIDIEDALKSLIDAGRVQKRRQGLYPRYELVIDERQGQWMRTLARLNWLRRAVTPLSLATHSRFAPQDKQPDANLHAHQIKIRPEDIKLVQEFFDSELTQLVEELQRKAQDDPRAIKVSLSAFWAAQEAEKRAQ